MERVEAEHGADQVYWMDEHLYGAFATPEVTERAEWYDIYGWPYVQVDGCIVFMGIMSCDETAQALRQMIDTRLDETGGMSPVSITGDFRADGMSLDWDVDFRLLDPVSLTDLRATFMVIEDDVQGWDDETYPRVTRRIVYLPVTLESPGDSAHFAFCIPHEPDWDAAKLRSILFLQKTTGLKEIIQGAVLPNELLAGMEPLSVNWAAGSRIESVFPNPFQASTDVVVHFAEGSSRGPMRLEILDPLGRQVRELALPTVPAERVVVTWDGISNRGHRVPVGSYYVRLTTADGTSGGKVLRVR